MSGSAKIILSREELYNLVWRAPLNKTAGRFGISGAKLGQICDEHHVARPAHGHWTRVELGKPVDIRPLEPAPAGVAETIEIIPTAPRPEKPEPRGHGSPNIPEHLVRPHPLVTDWIAQRQREIQAKKEIYDPQLKRLVVPPPLSDADWRRWRVANALFKALDKKGITVKRGEQRKLEMIRGGTRIEFQLRYRAKRGQRPLTTDELRWHGPNARPWTYELNATDTLIFAIRTWLPRGMKSEWLDGSRGTIEEQLAEIVEGVLSAFPALEELHRTREEEKRRHEREVRERQEREQERKRDQARFRRFLEYAGDWREAEIARSFLATLRTRLPSDAEVVAGIRVAEWLSWAERKIEEHDRLAGDPLSIFESIAEVTEWTYRDG
jgi:hypothetical protein